MSVCQQGVFRDGGCDCGAGIYNNDKKQCDCFDKGAYNITTKKCQCPADYPLDDPDTKRCRSEAEAGAAYAAANPFPVWAIAVLSLVAAGGVALFAGGIWISERGLVENRAGNASVMAFWTRWRNPPRISPEELAARGLNDNGTVGGAASTGLGEGAWARTAPPLTTRLTISGMTSENGGNDNGQGDFPLTSRLSIPVFTGSS